MQSRSFVPLLLLLLLLLTSVFTAGTPANADAGEQAFRQRCQSCHSVVPGKSGPLGPNLGKVSGRPAASGDFRYSPAFKAAKVVWNRESLDRYLAGPTRMIPGSRMVVSVADPAQRTAIVNYLLTLR